MKPDESKKHEYHDEPEGNSTARRNSISDLRELLFHVNNVFHTRVNLLLVAESIFFAAIAALWKDGGTSVKLVMCGLGVVLTVMLWIANGALYKRSNHLTGELMKVDPIYLGYMNAVSVRKIPVTLMLAHALPAVSLIAWALVIMVVIGIIK